MPLKVFHHPMVFSFGLIMSSAWFLGRELLLPNLTQQAIKATLYLPATLPTDSFALCISSIEGLSFSSKFRSADRPEHRFQLKYSILQLVLIDCQKALSAM